MSEEEVVVTREECEAKARAAFNLLQDVRIHGGIRSIPKLQEALQHQVSVSVAQEIEKAAKKAEISKGAFYIERGLFYGLTLHRTELGYRFSYLFQMKIERNPDAVVK